jgi:hypothetical protein
MMRDRRLRLKLSPERRLRRLAIRGPALPRATATRMWFWDGTGVRMKPAWDIFASTVARIAESAARGCAMISTPARGASTQTRPAIWGTERWAVRDASLTLLFARRGSGFELRSHPYCASRVAVQNEAGSRQGAVSDSGMAAVWRRRQRSPSPPQCRPSKYLR